MEPEQRKAIIETIDRHIDNNMASENPDWDRVMNMIQKTRKNNNDPVMMRQLNTRVIGIRAFLKEWNEC